VISIAVSGGGSSSSSHGGGGGGSSSSHGGGGGGGGGGGIVYTGTAAEGNEAAAIESHGCTIVVHNGGALLNGLKKKQHKTRIKYHEQKAATNAAKASLACRWGQSFWKAPPEACGGSPAVKRRLLHG
jgi:hypothetical protein